MIENFSFDWQMAGSNLLRMLIAFALAFPLAWELPGDGPVRIERRRVPYLLFG